jgi:hypothetical protein
MTYFTEFTPDGTGVLHRGEGIVTGPDLIAAAAEHHRLEERARKLRYGFVDFSQVSELRVSAVEVQTIADENRRTAVFTPNAVVAVIAPLDHAFGVSRMWETLMDATNWTTRIFRDRDEALAWLRKQIPNAVS